MGFIVYKGLSLNSTSSHSLLLSLPGPFHPLTLKLSLSWNIHPSCSLLFFPPLFFWPRPKLQPPGTQTRKCFGPFLACGPVPEVLSYKFKEVCHVTIICIVYLCISVHLISKCLAASCSLKASEWKQSICVLEELS